MSEPPLDSDLPSLDVRKLKRLSQAMSLSEPLERWLSRAGEAGE
jgi:hypothetical protein